MRLTDDAIRSAFRTHGLEYGVQRGWEIPYHIECWSRAQRAFEQVSIADFDWLYDQLKRYWQVFRGGATPWTAAQTHRFISDLDSRYRSLRLSDLRDADLEGCWRIIAAMMPIKETKAPSVVAISKFLHFWNPRLFVIVDDAVMWQRVLSRSWIKRELAQSRAHVMTVLPHVTCPPADPSCDLIWYVAVLAWASDLVRTNPNITPLFDEHARANTNGIITALPLVEYDAAAVEWLLLGLAEIPPVGVEL